MSVKELFKKLGYENLFWQADHTIEYVKYEEDDFYGKKLVTSIAFHKRNKKIKIVGVITIEELQAINKQCEELRWNE